MEQPHIRKGRSSGWRVHGSICRGMRNSVRCLEKLPEVQCNQTLDFACHPEESGFHSGGNEKPRKDCKHEGLWSDLNYRMLTPAATGTEDGGTSRRRANWLENDCSSALEDDVAAAGERRRKKDLRDI